MEKENFELAGELKRKQQELSKRSAAAPPPGGGGGANLAEELEQLREEKRKAAEAEDFLKASALRKKEQELLAQQAKIPIHELPKVSASVCVYASVCASVCVYVSVCASVCVCACLRVCVWLHVRGCVPASLCRWGRNQRKETGGGRVQLEGENLIRASTIDNRLDSSPPYGGTWTENPQWGHSPG